MRALDVMTAAVRWRWTPFYGLVVASSLYVLVVVLVIPESIGGARKAGAIGPGGPLGDAVTVNVIGAAPGDHVATTLPRPAAGAERAANTPGFAARPMPPQTPFAPQAPAPFQAAAPPPPPPPPPPPVLPPEPEQDEDPPTEAPAPPPVQVQNRFFAGRLQRMPAPNVPQQAEEPADDEPGPGDDNSNGNSNEPEQPTEQPH